VPSFLAVTEENDDNDDIEDSIVRIMMTTCRFLLCSLSECFRFSLTNCRLFALPPAAAPRAYTRTPAPTHRHQEVVVSDEGGAGEDALWFVWLLVTSGEDNKNRFGVEEGGWRLLRCLPGK